MNTVRRTCPLDTLQRHSLSSITKTTPPPPPLGPRKQGQWTSDWDGLKSYLLSLSVVRSSRCCWWSVLCFKMTLSVPHCWRMLLGDAFLKSCHVWRSGLHNVFMWVSKRVCACVSERERKSKWVSVCVFGEGGVCYGYHWCHTFKYIPR